MKKKIREKGEVTKKTEPVQDQEVFLDAFKSLSKDNLEGFPIYSGSLNGEVLLDWIDALNNHFEYKEVAGEQRVNFAKARSKGFALVWWNIMQEERLQVGKKITSWERMKIRIKA